MYFDTIMMYGCRFITSNDRAGSGETWHVWGKERGLWETPVPSSKFCSEPKISLEQILNNPNQEIVYVVKVYAKECLSKTKYNKYY